MFLRGAVLFWMLSVSISDPTFAAGSIPSVEVTVRNGAEVAYHGTTSAAGDFVTKQLPAGDYTIEFRAMDLARVQQKQIAIALRAEQGVLAQSSGSVDVSVGRLMAKIKLNAPSRLSGQLSFAAGSAVQAKAGNAESGGNIKYVDGRKYVWLPPETGSHFGGRWVPADEINAHSTGALHGTGEILDELHSHSSH